MGKPFVLCSQDQTKSLMLHLINVYVSPQTYLGDVIVEYKKMAQKYFLDLFTCYKHLFCLILYARGYGGFFGFIS